MSGADSLSKASSYIIEDYSVSSVVLASQASVSQASVSPASASPASVSQTPSSLITEYPSSTPKQIVQGLFQKLDQGEIYFSGAFIGLDPEYQVSFIGDDSRIRVDQILAKLVEAYSEVGVLKKIRSELDITRFKVYFQFPSGSIKVVVYALSSDLSV